MSDLEFLEAAVRAFHREGIEFVLIGGMAMIAHGANNVTQDVDFAYKAELENIDRLADFLKTINARILARPRNDGFVISSFNLERSRFLNLVTDLGEVDVMREIAGVDSFEGLRQRAVLINVGGVIVPVASIDDLLSMKRAANRPKDREHIFLLLALKKMATDQTSEPIPTEDEPDTKA